ncbi:DNA-packaging protein [Kordiimonas pumila]|uniref:DNA-packaging protein n=1 Tax=Kordiimonas pumila TaxID=2161677 RepID=A0ABV7D425_9PROT|nr:terminase family protein [Kordiimonas pumila]
MHFSASSLKQLPPSEQADFLNNLTEAEASLLLYDWAFWARANQRAPLGSWSHWLVLAGRGYGKTRAGAEWVREQAALGPGQRIALVGPTLNDARAVMVEGESGLLAVSPPWNRPKFEASKRLLTWPNGSMASLFSAEDPERLRGHQHHAAWCDELCAWRHTEDTWDNLVFGLRLGAQPRTMTTTTPKPIALLKKLLAAVEGGTVAVTRGSTFENLANLAPTFAGELVAKYKGTRLGRQELMAEILEDVPGALWQRTRLEQLRVSRPPTLVRIVVAIDPPTTAGEKADECGIIAAGIDAEDRGYIIADSSEQGLSPMRWAAKAVGLYHSLQADRIVIETNQGGLMAENVIRQVDASVPVAGVHATRSKHTRAEPVAALYEQGRIFHAGQFPELEDQMCTFTGSGTSSPDRVDALVWAVTSLMLSRPKNPTIRTL